MVRKRSYQKGNVQWHNGQWTLRYREWDYEKWVWAQKRVILEGDFRNKAQDSRAADPIMVKVNEHNNEGKAKAGPEPLTFGRFLETRFREYQRQQGHKRSTIDTYDGILRLHILPVLRDKAIRAITPGQITDLFKGLAKLSQSSKGQVYAILHAVFELARQLDLIEASPVRSKIHRPSQSRKEKGTLTPEQIRAVIAEMPERYQLLTLLAALTGKRIGEILALRRCDFDAEKSELSINHSLYKGELKSPKSVSSQGVVYLTPAVAALLVEHRRSSPFPDPPDFIFCQPDGRPIKISGLIGHLGRAMERAGISRIKGQHGFHVFRHTAGSLLYAETNDLKLVQKALGHSRAEITSNIYVHLEEKKQSEASSILTNKILDMAARKKDKAG